MERILECQRVLSCFYNVGIKNIPRPVEWTINNEIDNVYWDEGGERGKHDEF